MFRVANRLDCFKRIDEQAGKLVSVLHWRCLRSRWSPPPPAQESTRHAHVRSGSKGEELSVSKCGRVCSRKQTPADRLAMSLCARMYGPAARCKTDFQERRTWELHQCIRS